MRKPAEALAVVASDLHFSARPPIARSVEGAENWLHRQAMVLQQIQVIQEKHSNLELGPIPVLLAGDIFHTHNEPPSVVNMVLRNMPENTLAIPGQHDLPYHNHAHTKDSAFGTLDASRKIHDIWSPKLFKTYTGFRFVVHACHWGNNPKPLDSWDHHSKDFNILLMHRYIWKDTSSCYPGALASENVLELKQRIRGFKVVVVGDNHKPFEAKVGKTLVFNCGGAQRRNIDEVKHKPRIGVIFSDGTVKSIPLYIGDDKFADSEDDVHLTRDDRIAESFIEGLMEIRQKKGSNFKLALRNAMGQVKSKHAREALIEIMEHLDGND